MIGPPECIANDRYPTRRSLKAGKDPRRHPVSLRFGALTNPQRGSVMMPTFGTKRGRSCIGSHWREALAGIDRSARRVRTAMQVRGVNLLEKLFTLNNYRETVILCGKIRGIPMRSINHAALARLCGRMKILNASMPVSSDSGPAGLRFRSREPARKVFSLARRFPGPFASARRDAGNRPYAGCACGCDNHSGLLRSADSLDAV